MTEINLGDLMTALYDEYLVLYGDENIAAVATAATINEILAEQAFIARTGVEIECAA